MWPMIICNFCSCREEIQEAHAETESESREGRAGGMCMELAVSAMGPSRKGRDAFERSRERGPYWYCFSLRPPIESMSTE